MKQKNYGMKISIIACLTVQLCIGILYLWSVYRAPVVAYYNWTVPAATMVSSYMIFAFVIGNLIGGFAQVRMNPKTVATIGCAVFCSGLIMTSFLTAETVQFMYLTYSVISGLGCGFAYGSVLFCVIRWLPHRRGFASGLSASAFGLSTVVFSPVSKWLLGLEAFGADAVPMTFRTLGIIFLVVSMISCMFIRQPSKEYVKSLNLPAAATAITGKGPKEVTKTPAFWCIFLCSFLLTGLWLILVPLMADLGMDKGLSSNLAVLTVSLTGITNAAGRLLLASLSDKIGRIRTVQLLGLLTIICAMGILTFAGVAYMALVLIVAMTYGGASSVFPALTTDLYGPKFASINYGIILLSIGFSSIIFNAVSNTLIGNTGGYSMSFVLAACSGLVSILLMVYVNRVFKQQTEQAYAK